MKGYDVDSVRVAQARLALTGQDGKPLKQVDAAHLLDVHPVTLNRIENGVAKVSLELLGRMVEKYGVSREWLLGDPEMVDDFDLARTKMNVVLEEFSQAVDLLQRAARAAATETDVEVPA